GKSSGQTMFIMADTLKRVEAVTHRKDRKKTAKIVMAIVLLSLAGFGALGFVIWQQKKQIEEILHKKDGLDKQISKIQVAMQIETDPDKLVSLEEQLTALTGKAQAAIGELQKKDKSEAEKIEQSGDELERAGCGSSSSPAPASSSSGSSGSAASTSAPTFSRARTPPRAIWRICSPSSARTPSCSPSPPTTRARTGCGACCTRSRRSRAGS